MKFAILLVILLTNLFLTISMNISPSVVNQRCNIFTRELTEDEIKLIVESHNHFRSRVALGKTKTRLNKYATNLIQMYWDDELAKKAREYADLCRLDHSALKDRKHRNYYYGENILIGGGEETPDWKKTIKTWFSEIRGFSKKDTNMYRFDENTGNISQVLWAESYWIGCGYGIFNNKSLYICNYGPTGNVVNKRIFLGSSKIECRCIKGLSCNNKDYPGLCCPESHCTKTSLRYKGEAFDGTIPQIK